MNVRRLSILSLMAVSLGFVLLVALNEPLKSSSKWLLLSQRYKDKISALPSPADGLLKHIEWDSWGFPGAGNTVMYLVFDPANALEIASETKKPGMYPGLPCEVFQVKQMERNWYTVLFYTDTDWQHCAGNR
jgi:hypothetical protein